MEARSWTGPSTWSPCRLTRPDPGVPSSWATRPRRWPGWRGRAGALPMFGAAERDMGRSQTIGAPGPAPASRIATDVRSGRLSQNARRSGAGGPQAGTGPTRPEAVGRVRPGPAQQDLAGCSSALSHMTYHERDVQPMRREAGSSHVHTVRPGMGRHRKARRDARDPPVNRLRPPGTCRTAAGRASGAAATQHEALHQRSDPDPPNPHHPGSRRRRPRTRRRSMGVGLGVPGPLTGMA